jgi:putative SOS response-associated peptidase YedK
VCGRYVAANPAAVLADWFEVDETVGEPPPASYNVAPTDPVPAVAESGDGIRRLGRFRWGLAPAWLGRGARRGPLINARSETVVSRPAFRAAFARRRCLLPADGFYEWERLPDAGRRAWFIRSAWGGPLAMAGLWEPGEGGDPGTCAILTTTPNGVMAGIHDRMPVLLARDDWPVWLDRRNADVDALSGLLAPAADAAITRHSVGPRVNDVRNNDADLLRPEPSPAGPGRQ